jgi:hypothetical protein
VDVDRVDRVKDVLRSSSFLIPIRELAHSDRNAQIRQSLLGLQHLLSKLAVWQDVVVERLGAKLDHARDELAQWVRVKSAEQAVAPTLPLIRAVKTKLPARCQVAPPNEKDKKRREMKWGSI